MSGAGDRRYMEIQLLSPRLDRFRHATQLAALIGVVVVLVLLVRAWVPFEPGGAAPPQRTAVTQQAPVFGFPSPVRSRMTTQPTQRVYVCSLRQPA
jgi:hypothetical protein